MKKAVVSLLFAAVLMVTAGCAAHVGYRVYDPYYSDYHVWGPDEGVYYRQWNDLNHRPYREYRRLRREDQHAYWTWRHQNHEERRERR